MDNEQVLADLNRADEIRDIVIDRWPRIGQGLADWIADFVLDREKEAKAAGLEEAAKVADNFRYQECIVSCPGHHETDIAEDIAARIRRLGEANDK